MSTMRVNKLGAHPRQNARISETARYRAWRLQVHSSNSLQMGTVHVHRNCGDQGEAGRSGRQWIHSPPVGPGDRFD